MKKHWFCLILFFVHNQFIAATNNDQPDKNCCPCPDTSTADSRIVQAAVSPLDNVDCLCQARDSQPASSILTRNFGPMIRTSEPKGDSKPLLHPEVDLASSVLQALHEATDEEYQDALERDSVRNALKDYSKKHNNDETPSKNLVTIVVNSPGIYDMEVDSAGEESHQHEARCALGHDLGATRKKIFSYRPSLLNSQRIPNFDIFDQEIAASSMREKVKELPEFSDRIPNLKTTNAYTDITSEDESTVKPLNILKLFNLENRSLQKNKVKSSSGINGQSEYDSDFSPSIINTVVQTDQTEDCLNSKQESEFLRQSPLKQNNYPNDKKLKKNNINENLNAVEKLHTANMEYLSNKIKENNLKLRNSFLESPKTINFKNKNHKIEVKIEPMKINSKISSLRNTQSIDSNINPKKFNNILKSTIDECERVTDIPNESEINSKSINVEDLEVMSNTLLEKSIKKENNEIANNNNSIFPQEQNQTFEIKKKENETDNIFECESNIDNNSQTNINNNVDTNGQASETFVKSLPLSKSAKALHDSFIKTLQQNKVVQPEFLLPRSSDISKLKIDDNFFKDLPSIDDIKDKVSELFNINEIKQKSPFTSKLGNMPSLAIPNIRENKKIFPENVVNVDIFRMQPLKSSLLLPGDLNTGLNMNSFKTNLPNLQSLPIRPIKLESIKKAYGDILGASISFADIDSHLEQIKSTVLDSPQDNNKLHEKVKLASPKKKSNIAESNNGKLTSKQIPSLGLVTIPTLKPLQLANKELTSLPPSIASISVGDKSQSISPYNKALLMNVFSNTNLVDPIIERKEQPTNFLLNPLETFGFDSNKYTNNKGISNNNLENKSIVKAVSKSTLPSKINTRRKPFDLKALLDDDKVSSKSNYLDTSLKKLPLTIRKSTKNNKLQTNKKIPSINEVLSKRFEPKSSNILGLQNYDWGKKIFNYPFTPLTESVPNNPLLSLGKTNLEQPLRSQDLLSSLPKQLSSSPLLQPTSGFLKSTGKLSKDLQGSADTHHLRMHNNIIKDKLLVKPLVIKLRESINSFAKINGLTYNNKNGAGSIKNENMLENLDNMDDIDMNSANTCKSSLVLKADNNKLDNYGETSNNILVTDIEFPQSESITENNRDSQTSINLTNPPNNQDDLALVTNIQHEEQPINDIDSAQSSNVNIYNKKLENILSKKTMSPIKLSPLEGGNLQTSVSDLSYKFKDLASLNKLDAIEISNREPHNNQLLSKKSPVDEYSLQDETSPKIILGDNDPSQSVNDIEAIKCTENSTSSSVTLRSLINQFNDNLENSDVELRKSKHMITQLSKEDDGTDNSNDPELYLLKNIDSSLQYFTNINETPLINNTIPKNNKDNSSLVSENINTKVLAKPLNFDAIKKLISFKERNKQSPNLLKDSGLNSLLFHDIAATKPIQENEDSIIEPTEIIAVTQNTYPKSHLRLLKDQSIEPDESNTQHTEQNNDSELTQNNELMNPLNFDVLKDLISSFDKRKPSLKPFKSTTLGFISSQSTKEDSDLAEQSENQPVTKNTKLIDSGLFKNPLNFNAWKELISPKYKTKFQLFEDKKNTPMAKDNTSIGKTMHLDKNKSKDNSVFKCLENEEVVDNLNIHSDIDKPFSLKDISSSENPINQYSQSLIDESLTPTVFQNMEREIEEVPHFDYVDIDSIVEPTENLEVREFPSNFKTIKVGKLMNFDNVEGPIFDGLQSGMTRRIETPDENECTDVELAASNNLPTSLCAMGQPKDGNVSYKCKLVCTKE